MKEPFEPVTSHVRKIIDPRYPTVLVATGFTLKG
jgi:hypothetical protein